MKLEEKRVLVARLTKRITRFHQWIEYYDSEDTGKLLECMLKCTVLRNTLLCLVGHPIKNI